MTKYSGNAELKKFAITLERLASLKSDDLLKTDITELNDTFLLLSGMRFQNKHIDKSRVMALATLSQLLVERKRQAA